MNRAVDEEPPVDSSSEEETFVDVGDEPVLALDEGPPQHRQPAVEPQQQPAVDAFGRSLSSAWAPAARTAAIPPALPEWYDAKGSLTSDGFSALRTLGARVNSVEFNMTCPTNWRLVGPGSEGLPDFEYLPTSRYPKLVWRLFELSKLVMQTGRAAQMGDQVATKNALMAAVLAAIGGVHDIRQAQIAALIEGRAPVKLTSDSVLDLTPEVRQDVISNAKVLKATGCALKQPAVTGSGPRRRKPKNRTAAVASGQRQQGLASPAAKEKKAGAHEAPAKAL